MRKRSSIIWVCSVWLLFGGLLTNCDDSGDGLIHSQACTETFTACGGDPVGTWDIVAVCTDGNIADEYNKDESPECSGLHESVTLAAAGSVKYVTSSVVYKGQVQESASTDYSPSCAEATQGITALDSDTCHELQLANTDSRTGKVARCKFEGGNCRCIETRTVDVGGAYVYRAIANGTSILEEDGSVYDFCIEGNTMRQRENIYGDAYVVTTLKRQ
jgi:hypothetical protein